MPGLRVIAKALGLGAAAILMWRRRHSAALEREWMSKHRPGPTGVIPGAESIELAGQCPGSVLLLHGFGDTPQSLRHVAAHLHATGLTVHAPLLPGHGRTPREFDAVSAAEWVGAARQAYRVLCDRFAEVSIVGVSMGGAIAAMLTTEERTPSALVLIAPYLEMGGLARWSARLHWGWGWTGPFVKSGGEGSIGDADERARSLSYGIVSARVLRELARVSRGGAAALPRLAAPTLMIQSRTDNRIPVAAAQRAFERIGAVDKRLVWVEDGRHVLTVDVGYEEVQRLAARWIVDHSSRAERSSGAGAP